MPGCCVSPSSETILTHGQRSIITYWRTRQYSHCPNAKPPMHEDLVTNDSKLNNMRAEVLEYKWQWLNGAGSERGSSWGSDYISSRFWWRASWECWLVLQRCLVWYLLCSCMIILGRVANWSQADAGRSTCGEQTKSCMNVPSASDPWE